MAGRRWTTPRGPDSRFPLNKENVNKFLWYSGACYCRHNTRQSYNHCHILHNFSFAKRSSAYSVNGTDSRSVLNPVASRQCSPSQSSHHTDVPWSHDNCISLMELPPHSPELAPFDFWLFPKINPLLLGSLFQGSKTLVKLCIQRWGSYLLQSTGNLSEVKDAVPDPWDLEIRVIGGGGGARSSRTLDIGGPVSTRNFFRPFRPQFCLTIMGEAGGGGPPPPPPPPDPLTYGTNRYSCVLAQNVGFF